MSDLSLDELLKSLEEAEASSKRKKRKAGEHRTYSTVERFVNEFGVEIGVDRVPNYVIYYTYRIIWKGQKVDSKTNKINFFREFNKKFTQVRTGKQRYYLLDGDKFDFSREGKLEAKFYDDKEKKRVKTQAAKKKKKKVSTKKPEHET